jgi:hypothetical protein
MLRSAIGVVISQPEEKATSQFMFQTRGIDEREIEVEDVEGRGHISTVVIFLIQWGAPYSSRPPHLHND